VLPHYRRLQRYLRRLPPLVRWYAQPGGVDDGDRIRLAGEGEAGAEEPEAVAV
jgi:hypothetical protein